MSESKGYYSIIQYCPDPGKSEGVNVGVALFVPDRQFADARMSANNSRARKFFGKAFDIERLKSAKRAIRNRINVECQRFQSIEDIQSFIHRRADAIRMLDPRPMRVGDPRLELNELFSELVESEKKKKDTDAHFQQVDSIFHDPEIERWVKFNQVVEIPIARKQLKVPYQYRNGVDVYVRTQRFSQPGQAEQMALEGQLIRDKLESRLIVVGAASEEDEELREIAKGLLEYFQVDLFWEHETDRLREKVKADLQLSS